MCSSPLRAPVLHHRHRTTPFRGRHTQIHSNHTTTMPRLSQTTYPRPVRQIEVAPGTKYLPVDVRKIPAVGVFYWKPVQVQLPKGNTITAYMPVEEVHDAWLRISEAEKLPFGLSAEVIRKLIRGGFVEGNTAAPNNNTVNVRSLLEHIEQTRADFDFWKRDDRRSRFENGVDFSEEN